MTVESDGGDATVATTMVDADTDAADVTDAEEALIEEGEIAGDYLEQLLDVLDFDGDIDLDVEGDRAVVSIDGGRDLSKLVGRNGEVLDALQELTRLAVQQATGVRSRLMLDVMRLAGQASRGAECARHGRREAGAGDRRPRVAGSDDAVRAQDRARRRCRHRRCGERERGRGTQPACGCRSGLMDRPARPVH